MMILFRTISLIGFGTFLASLAAATIVNPAALGELQENITEYTVPRNYGSASFNVVRALYPGAVGL